jgi:DNA-binding NarL/FixJ family response regulator
MVKSVLIADDNAFVRQRLGELFRREPDFEVCAEAQNGKQAIEEAHRSQPDLIVLDLSMPSNECPGCGAYSKTDDA